MRFGPWYALAEAGDRAPAAPGVYQIRLAHGLHDYPRGKSAMVWYEHAPDVRAAVLRFAAAHPGALLCRHLIEGDTGIDPLELCAKLRAEFVRRFGAPPLFETTPP